MLYVLVNVPSKLSLQEQIRIDAYVTENVFPIERNSQTQVPSQHISPKAQQSSANFFF
jgi:hypothetical protein